MQKWLIAPTIAAFLTVAAQAQSPSPVKIYIMPQPGGFESYISAAMVKKHVPAVVTDNQEEAKYVLKSAVQAKEESTGSKIARCLFLYCLGIQGTQAASVLLVDKDSNEVVWAYQVMKPSASAYQSTSEAIAKHLKGFLERGNTATK